MNPETALETERLRRKYRAQQPRRAYCEVCGDPAVGWTAGGPDDRVFRSCEYHWGTAAASALGLDPRTAGSTAPTDD